MRTTKWLAIVALAALACGAPAGGDVGGATAAVIEWDDDMAGPVPDVPAPTLERPVTIASDTDERSLGVRVVKRSGGTPQPRLVYAAHVAAVQPGEQLRVQGEVTLSRCNPSDIAGDTTDSYRSPCNSVMNPAGSEPPLTVNEGLGDDPYEYAPRFRAQIVLGPLGTTGTVVHESPWMRCPQRRHHCSLALPEFSFAPTGETWVNLVVIADDAGPPSSIRDARSWDAMEIEQQHGALTVIRLAPGAADPSWASESMIQTKKIRIGTPGAGPGQDYRSVVYRTMLGALTGGVVQARARVGIRLRPLSHSTVRPLVTTQLLLTTDPTAVRPGTTPGPDGVLGSGDDGWAIAITARNGANCYDRNGLCVYQDEGAVEIPGPPPSGSWYVVEVVGALRDDAPPGGKDFVRVRALPMGQWHGIQLRIR